MRVRVGKLTKESFHSSLLKAGKIEKLNSDPVESRLHYSLLQVLKRNHCYTKSRKMFCSVLFRRERMNLDKLLPTF